MTSLLGVLTRGHPLLGVDGGGRRAGDAVWPVVGMWRRAWPLIRGVGRRGQVVVRDGQGVAEGLGRGSSVRAELTVLGGRRRVAVVLPMVWDHVVLLEIARWCYFVRVGVLEHVAVVVRELVLLLRVLVLLRVRMLILLRVLLNRLHVRGRQRMPARRRLALDVTRVHLGVDG